MQRYIQFTIPEPLELSDERVQIEMAIIGIDLHTGYITLPGGFVCTLASLTTVIDKMRAARRNWIWGERGPYRKVGKT